MRQDPPGLPGWHVRFFSLGGSWRRTIRGRTLRSPIMADGPGGKILVARLKSPSA